MEIREYMTDVQLNEYSANKADVLGYVSGYLDEYKYLYIEQLHGNIYVLDKIDKIEVYDSSGEVTYIKYNISYKGISIEDIKLDRERNNFPKDLEYELTSGNKTEISFKFYEHDANFIARRVHDIVPMLFSSIDRIALEYYM